MDFLSVIFLAGGERSGEELGGGVDNYTDTGFEFKRVPKKDVGFVLRERMVKLLVIEVLVADKPGERGDQKQGRKGEEGRKRIEGLGKKED